jgi:hypothetical protein
VSTTPRFSRLTPVAVAGYQLRAVQISSRGPPARYKACPYWHRSLTSNREHPSRMAS